MKKGFTLIELLVVISIIGVLSTIVLGSLGDARDRAGDAKIKALMSQMRTQAELFNLDYGSYRGTDTSGWRNDDTGECTNSSNGATGSILDRNIDGSITDLILEVNSISSAAGVRVFCGVTGSTGDDSWAFAAPLLSPAAGTTGWCVDSSGNSKAFTFAFGVGDATNSNQLGSQTTSFMCP